VKSTSKDDASGKDSEGRDERLALAGQEQLAVDNGFPT
jgi:hypothetical protein